MVLNWKEKLQKVLRGAAIAAVGAAVPALLEFGGTLDDGTAMGAFLAALFAVIANAVRKFFLED